MYMYICIYIAIYVYIYIYIYIHIYKYLYTWPPRSSDCSLGQCVEMAVSAASVRREQLLRSSVVRCGQLAVSASTPASVMSLQ